jgi:hypothetical protein
VLGQSMLSSDLSSNGRLPPDPPRNCLVELRGLEPLTLTLPV